MAQSRVTVITGAASGIGLAAAKKFAASGDLIIAADIAVEQGQAAVAELHQQGGHAVFYPLDVSNDNSVAEFADIVAQQHGPAGVLINSAGLLQNAALVKDYDMDEHDRIWQANYRGTYLCSRVFGAQMCEQGNGVIINLASMVGLRAMPLPAYAPGKAAVISLTELLAVEYGAHGVRVNALAPGYVLTPALKARIEAGQRDPKVMENTTALGELILPEDIAESAWFLCSEAARKITGVTLPIDAGWLVATSYKAYAGLPQE